MLDQDHRISVVDQAMQDLDEQLYVSSVQTDRRFFQKIESGLRSDIFPEPLV